MPKKLFYLLYICIVIIYSSAQGQLLSLPNDILEQDYSFSQTFSNYYFISILKENEGYWNDFDFNKIGSRIKMTTIDWYMAKKPNFHIGNIDSSLNIVIKNHKHDNLIVTTSLLFIYNSIGVTCYYNSTKDSEKSILFSEKFNVNKISSIIPLDSISYFD